jgi:ABC-type multidrug transport system fused ATPase/permease subunit
MNSVGQMNAYAFTVDHLMKARSGADDAAGMGTGRGEAANGGEEAAVNGDAVPAIHSVSFRRLSFSYQDRPVLHKQDLEIAAGEFIGICGPSGKGKSTILNLLLGFLAPDSGDICINGSPTDVLARRSFWSRIAYVKQQPFLLHDTIMHNITLGGWPDDGGRLLDAAGATGLLPLIDSFPEKWDKIIAENGKNISGGQRQRIAFARALYKNADLLILDEPFSELDESSEREMMDLCLDLTRHGKTVLLITHNQNNLSFCHKTIVLDEA